MTKSQIEFIEKTTKFWGDSVGKDVNISHYHDDKYLYLTVSYVWGGKSDKYRVGPRGGVNAYKI